MFKNKKLVGLYIGSVCILIVVFFIFFSVLKHSQPSQVPGKPLVHIDHPIILSYNQNFPTKNPQFLAVLGTDKASSGKHQSIRIYRLTDKNKTSPVFESNFYSDGFHGDSLTYSFDSNLPTFTQQGSLGNIGCNTQNCQIPWENFYTWDKTKQAFILDNTSHREDFQILLSQFQSLEARGKTEPYFVASEEVLHKIVNGENLGSNDIKDVAMNSNK